MTTTNTDAFPSKDTDYTLVDPATNTTYQKFDYLGQRAQHNDQLKAHGVVLTEVQQQATTGQAVYRGPECINDPLSSSNMATHRWKNASDPAVHDYAALYHLKHWLVTGIDTAVNMWCVSKQRENPGAEPEYKVGVEVKALFQEEPHRLLLTGAESLEEKKMVMFINRVLQKVISGQPSKEDREDIGSLISAVECGSVLMRTTTETVLMSSTTTS